MHFAFCLSPFCATFLFSRNQQGEKPMTYTCIPEKALWGRNETDFQTVFIPLGFLYVHICIFFFFTRLIVAIDVMRFLMGCLIHRAEVDTGRHMSCQAKVRPISHTGMIRIDKLGTHE